jgi:ElaB/YqjD/DUF883 family membrane-anchored ribosome-binding protein
MAQLQADITETLRRNGVDLSEKAKDLAKVAGKKAKRAVKLTRKDAKRSVKAATTALRATSQSEVGIRTKIFVKDHPVLAVAGFALAGFALTRLLRSYPRADTEPQVQAPASSSAPTPQTAESKQAPRKIAVKPSGDAPRKAAAPRKASATKAPDTPANVKGKKANKAKTKASK